jgi:hypothetical protein
MTRTLPLILGFLGGVGLLATSCSSRNGGAATQVADDGGEAGSPTPGIDAGAAGDDASDDAPPSPPPQAFLRMAQLSPDLPSIDVCVAPHGTTGFLGPLLAQLAGTGGEDGGTDAAPPGLTYPQVSAYLSLAAGQYDVRLVAAGATSCLPSLLPPNAPDDVDGGPGDAATDAAPDGSSSTPDWTDLPPLAFNTSTTLLVAGDWEPIGGDPGVTVAMLGDDAVLAGGAAVLRAVNAVPSWPAADFGLGSFATEWMPMLTGVSFAAASAHASPYDGVVDVHGYLAIAPLSGQAMEARLSSGDAGSAGAVASGVAIDMGSIATLIAVGGKTGDATHPPGLLLCTDNQPSGGLLSNCNIVP